MNFTKWVRDSQYNNSRLDDAWSNHMKSSLSNIGTKIFYVPEQNKPEFIRLNNIIFRKDTILSIQMRLNIENSLIKSQIYFNPESNVYLLPFDLTLIDANGNVISSHFRDILKRYLKRNTIISPAVAMRRLMTYPFDTAQSDFTDSYDFIRGLYIQQEQDYRDNYNLTGIIFDNEISSCNFDIKINDDNRISHRTIKVELPEIFKKFTSIFSGSNYVESAHKLNIIREEYKYYELENTYSLTQVALDYFNEYFNSIQQNFNAVNLNALKDVNHQQNTKYIEL